MTDQKDCQGTVLQTDLKICTKKFEPGSDAKECKENAYSGLIVYPISWLLNRFDECGND